MLSSEISDLESFIDSYAGPDKSTGSPQSWSRTHSYEEGFVDSPKGTTQFSNSYPQQYNDGTEMWGERTSSGDWHSTIQARANQRDWNEYRPRIQERNPIWHQQTMQGNPNFPGMWQDSGYQEHLEQGHDPNQIQTMVTHLIRQNNLNKPQNLPNWVDVSKPPPPLPSAVGPPMNYNHPEGHLAHRGEMIGHEPILQTMTFERSPNRQPNMYMPSPSPDMGMGGHTGYPPQSYTPQGTQEEAWGSNGREDPYNPMFQAHPQQWGGQQYFEPPISSYPYHGGPAIGAPMAVLPDFNTQIMQGGLFEQPDAIIQADLENTRPPPLTATLPKQPVDQPPKTTAANVLKQSQTKQSKPEAEPRQSTNRKETHSVETTAQAKYPNSKLRNSRSSASDDPELGARDKTQNRRSYQRQGSQEVFENEKDERWRTQNIQIQISNKKANNRRKSSAADDDPDWRRRDDIDTLAPNSGRHFSRHSSSDNDQRNRSHNKNSREKRDSVNVNSHGREGGKSEKQSKKSREQSSGAEHPNHDNHRHVTEKSKSKVQSWIQDSGKTPNSSLVGQEIHRLQISDSEADLTKFIQTTQAFATTEDKMREVAEILCNKALKNPKFSRNASTLCDRMSWMMVHGTKFRSVVLNVMQGHYKTREQMYAASFRSDRRWFGFVAFLVEIFLNVRTSTHERLLVMVTPVFNCLFQVLTVDRVDQDHIECFGRLFLKAGPSLEAESPSRMNELMGEIRDRLVTTKAGFVKRVLLKCVEQYASKWQQHAHS